MAHTDGKVKSKKDRGYHIISVVVDPEQYREVRQLSRTIPRQSMSAWVRVAIDRLLKDVRSGLPL